MTTFTQFLLKYSITFARFSLFITYFWFGALKIIGSSPAESIVFELQTIVLPFIDSNTFMILFGIFEIVIGIAFLIPQLTKIASILFLAHIVTTFLPLILLQDLTWNNFPSFKLEGQYIFKNIVLISLVWVILADYIKSESTYPTVEQHEPALQK